MTINMTADTAFNNTLLRESAEKLENKHISCGRIEVQKHNTLKLKVK